MSAEYNFTFDWDRISTLGKVKVLVEQVVSSGGGGGGGADSRVNLVVGSNIYPLISVTKTTVNGVSGVLWRYDDGSQDGLSEFIADGTGLNTVKTAIENQIPHAASEIEWDGGQLDGGHYDTLDEAVDAVYAAIPATASTVVAGNTNPVNSVAVIAYINSLDATNTQY